MSSTGATADGFDRQFGIGRAVPRQSIGNVEALCQAIDPGRVFIGKSLRGRGRHGGSPSRFSACTCPMSARHIASTGRGPVSGPVIWRERVPEMVRFKYRAFLSYSHPDTRSTDMTGLQAELEADSVQLCNLERHAVPKKRPKSVRDDRAMLENVILPAVGTKKVASIEQRDIESMHLRLRDRPYQANREARL